MEVRTRQQGETLPLLGPSFTLPRFGALGSKCYNLFFEQYLKPLPILDEGRHKTKLLRWECTLHYAKIFEYADQRVHQRIFYLVDYTTIRSTMGKQHPKRWAAPSRYPHYCTRFMGLRRPERFSQGLSPLTLFRLSAVSKPTQVNEPSLVRYHKITSSSLVDLNWLQDSW